MYFSAGNQGLGSAEEACDYIILRFEIAAVAVHKL